MVSDTSGIMSDTLTFTLTGILVGQERQKGPENIFEDILPENSSNLGKEIDIQIWEVHIPVQNYLKEEYSETHYN